MTPLRLPRGDLLYNNLDSAYVRFDRVIEDTCAAGAQAVLCFPFAGSFGFLVLADGVVQVAAFHEGARVAAGPEAVSLIGERLHSRTRADLSSVGQGPLALLTSYATGVSVKHGYDLRRGKPAGLIGDLQRSSFSGVLLVRATDRVALVQVLGGEAKAIWDDGQRETTATTDLLQVLSSFRSGHVDCIERGAALPGMADALSTFPFDTVLAPHAAPGASTATASVLEGDALATLLARLEELLAEAIGPMAPFLVDDALAELDADREAISANLVVTLVAALAEQVPESRRQAFLAGAAAVGS